MPILLIIVGIVLFNFIIFAHEFGHFFWAKKFGVKVNEFSLGMGPKIFKFQKSEMLFSLRLFPIGGFCDMEGEDADSADPRAFGTKHAWQKFIIVIAGAIMNIIIGFIMTFILLIPSQRFASTTIAGFNENAVSSSSGLMEGDKILSVDNTKVYTYNDLIFDLSADGKSEFNIKVKRNGKTTALQNVHFNTKTNANGKSATVIDFAPEFVDKNFGTLIKQSCFNTASTVKIVWTSLSGIITGRFAFNNMSGPIGIVSVIGEASSKGLQTSIWAAIGNIVAIMAMITINLGVINLLPLPALDGGRLIFLLFEIITGKKINPKYEGWIHALGFFLFIGLMLYISYSDILRLCGKI